MRSVLSLRCIVLVLVLGLVSVAVGQEKPLPSGKEVLNKYIEVTGGREARERIRSRILHSNISIPSANISGNSKAFNEGSKCYVVLTLAGLGEERRGSDGSVFWQLSTSTGPRIFKGQEREFWERASALDSDLEVDRFYKSVETQGIENIDGRAAYKVVFTSKSGSTETRFYDQVSGLLTKVEQTMKTSDGEIPVASSLADYREVDGVKLPFRISEVLAGTQQLIVTVDKVEHNVEIPPDRFELPPQIKKLLEKESGAATQPK